MGKIETLQKIEREVSEGKLGIARDRLHGLITSYPNDLSLRSGLGDIYAKLGYPREAGRYWFFDDPLTEEKREAIALFLKDCRYDPAVILRRLRLGGDVEQLSTKAAKARVKELIEDCERRGLELPPSKPSPAAYNYLPNGLVWGCGIVAAIVLLFAIIGAVAVATGSFGR